MVRELAVEGMTIIWSTAYLDEAHSFDSCIVLNEGKVIFDGKPQEVVKTTAEFEEKVIGLMGGFDPEPSLLAKNLS